MVERSAAWKEWGLHWNKVNDETFTTAISDEEGLHSSSPNATEGQIGETIAPSRYSTLRGLEKMQTEIGALIQELQNKRDSNGKEAILQAKLASLSYDLEAYRKAEAENKQRTKMKQQVNAFLNNTEGFNGKSNHGINLELETNGSIPHKLEKEASNNVSLHNASTVTSVTNDVAGKYFVNGAEKGDQKSEQSTQNTAVVEPEDESAAKPSKASRRRQVRARNMMNLSPKTVANGFGKVNGSSADQMQQMTKRIPGKVIEIMAKPQADKVKKSSSETASPATAKGEMRGDSSPPTRVSPVTSKDQQEYFRRRIEESRKRTMTVYQIGKDRKPVPIGTTPDQKGEEPVADSAVAKDAPKLASEEKAAQLKTDKTKYIMEIKDESLDDAGARFGSEPPRKASKDSAEESDDEEPTEPKLNFKALLKDLPKSNSTVSVRMRKRRFGEPPMSMSDTQISPKSSSEPPRGVTEDDIEEIGPVTRPRKPPPRPHPGPPRQRRFGEPPMNMFDSTSSGNMAETARESGPEYSVDSTIGIRNSSPGPKGSPRFDYGNNPSGYPTQRSEQARRQRAHAPDNLFGPDTPRSVAGEVRYARIHSPDEIRFDEMPRPELRDEFRGSVYGRVRRARSMEPDWLNDKPHDAFQTHFQREPFESRFHPEVRTEFVEERVTPDFRNGEFNYGPRKRASPMTRTRQNNIMDNVIDATIEKVEEAKEPSTEENTETSTSTSTASSIDAPPTDIWDTPFPITIDGDELRTWSFEDSSIERIQVFLKADGDNPLHANVDLWHGPDDTPQKMTVFVKEGSNSPFSAVMETPVGHNSVAIRNSGELGCFLRAAVVASDYGNGSHGFGPLAEKLTHMDPEEKLMEGGEAKLYPVPSSSKSVQLLLRTYGYPLNARVEVVDRKNHVSQLIEIYTEDGLQRPFFMVIETPGDDNIVRVVNTGFEGFPLEALMEPHVIST